MAATRDPDTWRGNDYHPSQMMRTRLYVIALIFAFSGLAFIWLGVRLLQQWAAQGPPAPAALWWLAGLVLVLLVPPLLWLVAWLLIRWPDNTYVRVAPQGLLYHEPTGALWTDWQNVESVARRRRGFTVVAGLALRGPARTARPRGWRWLAALQPLFVPSAAILGDRFIPLTTLGLDMRDHQPLPQDIRRYAPWLFPEPSEKK